LKEGNSIEAYNFFVSRIAKCWRMQRVNWKLQLEFVSSEQLSQLTCWAICGEGVCFSVLQNSSPGDERLPMSQTCVGGGCCLCFLRWLSSTAA
jgi:hypothetical protein